MTLALQLLELSQLSGIQTKRALTYYRLQDALSCVGGFFDTSGSYTKRRGGSKYNTSPFAAEVNGIYDFRFGASSSQVLLKEGSNLWNGNGGAPVLLSNIFTSGAIPDFVTYLNYAWMVDGVDAMIKYDGTTVTAAGITRPAVGIMAAVSANIGGATLPVGNYLIAVTFFNAAGEESNPSDSISGTVGGGDNALTVNDIPVSADPQVTGRNIYITNVGAGTLLFYGALNDNVTTTINVLNPPTGGLLEFDHDVPPVGLVGIEVFKDRIFGFKSNTVYFSKAFDVWYWPQGELDQEKIFTISIGDSTPITCIISYFDVLFVFKQSRGEVYAISGDDELNFRVDKIHADESVGCVSNRAARIIGNWCYFVGLNSVYRTNGVEIQDVGNPISAFFEQNYIDTNYILNKASIGLCTVEFVKYLNVLLVFIPTGQNSVNNMCFAMDINSVQLDQTTNNITADWTPWPGFTTQAVAIVNEFGQELWYRSDEYGYVFRQDQLDGDGSNITSTVTAAGANTLTDATQGWTVNLYAGLRVTVTAADSSVQEQIIASNDATTLTITGNWATVPIAGQSYTVGGIPFHYQHGWDSYGNKSWYKRWRYARPRFDTTGLFTIKIAFGFDFNTYNRQNYTIGSVGLSLWDLSLWDVALWDSIFVTQRKIGVPGSRIHIWSNFMIENNNAGQPIKYDGLDKLWQLKGVR